MDRKARTKQIQASGEAEGPVQEQNRVLPDGFDLMSPFEYADVSQISGAMLTALRGYDASRRLAIRPTDVFTVCRVRK